MIFQGYRANIYGTDQFTILNFMEDVIQFQASVSPPGVRSSITDVHKLNLTLVFELQVYSLDR